VYPKGMNTSLRSFRLGEVVRAGVIIAVAVVLVLVPRVALAHAVLVQSTPTINATVEGPEVAVSMKPVAIEHQSTPDTLTTHLTHLGPGKYAIRWQVLATDGHVTRGEIPFRVK